MRRYRPEVIIFVVRRLAAGAVLAVFLTCCSSDTPSSTTPEAVARRLGSELGLGEVSDGVRRYYAELYLEHLEFDEVRLLAADLSSASEEAPPASAVVFVLGKDGGFQEGDRESLGGVVFGDGSEFEVIIHRGVAVLVAAATERTVGRVREALAR